MSRFCACGCGEIIAATATWVKGHHWRALRAAAGIPDEKTCEWCRVTYTRKSIGSPQSNKHWIVRQFCGEACRRHAIAEYNREHEGEAAPSWLGDSAKEEAGRKRCRRIHALEPCEVCGSEKSERHHKDWNPLNNDRSNIQFLCRKHHMAVERALGLDHRNHPSRRRVAA